MPDERRHASGHLCQVAAVLIPQNIVLARRDCVDTIVEQHGGERVRMVPYGSDISLPVDVMVVDVPVRVLAMGILEPWMRDHIERGQRHALDRWMIGMRNEGLPIVDPEAVVWPNYTRERMEWTISDQIGQSLLRRRLRL